MKGNRFLWATVITSILIIFFVGIRRDGEFYGPKLFIKYSPTYKLFFYAQNEKFRAGDLEEEITYKEFVLDRGNIINSGFFSLLPFVLIQLAFSSFSFCVLKVRTNISYETWQFLTHFIICFILSSITISLLLKWDINYLTLIGTYFLLNINYWFLVLLVKRSAIVRVE